METNCFAPELFGSPGYKTTNCLRVTTETRYTAGSLQVLTPGWKTACLPLSFQGGL